MKLLLTYDISNTKNRTKLSTLLEGYGYRVNFSVFELDLKKHELRELLKLRLLQGNKHPNRSHREGEICKI